MSVKGETAAITPELYNAIVTIVDDRTKDIRVTRENFNELQASVMDMASAQRELAHAQAKTEERAGRLEDVVERLAQAQARTEVRVEELAEAQRSTEEALKELAMQVGKLSE